MCSIGEDDFGDEGGIHSMQKEPTEITSNIQVNQICNNCKTNNVVVKLAFKEAQCKSCFLMYVRHKFRAALGTTKIVRRGSNVLIDFDGSPNSLVLMHMINYAISQETFRKLHFNVFTLFIDENCIEQKEDPKSIIDNLKNILAQFNFNSNFFSCIDTDETLINVDTLNYLDITYDNIDFLKKLNSIKNLSLKQDFIRMTRKNILRLIAEKLDCQYIFTSEISTELAALVLADVALGRGQSAAFDVGFVDDRIEHAKIIRPIRDLTEAEVQHYIALTEIQHFNKSNFIYGKNKGEFSSIQNLTAHFVDGLQKNFSSTVSTVFRTGDKFALNRVKIESQCEFCKGLIDCENSETLHAIEFSSKVSTINNDREETSNLMKSLCHGCRNIFCNFD